MRSPNPTPSARAHFAARLRLGYALFAHREQVRSCADLAADVNEAE